VPSRTFHVVFACGSWFDFVCDELRDSLREVLVFGIEEGELD
jgi:hypothetical protein